MKNIILYFLNFKIFNKFQISKIKLKKILKVPKSESLESNLVFSSNATVETTTTKSQDPIFNHHHHQVQPSSEIFEVTSTPTLNTQQQQQQQPQTTTTTTTSLITVDSTSCVLPSKLKLRERSQSLNNTNTQLTTTTSAPIIFASPSSTVKTNNTTNVHYTNKSSSVVFTNGVTNLVTPGGNFIKNTTYSMGSSGSTVASANSGLAKRVTRSAANAREGLIRWCRKMTEEYENVCITNFSSSWSDGLAFCALLHHFMPDEFDYSQLETTNRRFNFDLAFRIAE